MYWRVGVMLTHTGSIGRGVLEAVRALYVYMVYGMVDMYGMLYKIPK